MLTGFLCSKKTRLLHIFENLKLQLLHKPLAKKAQKSGLLEKIKRNFASIEKVSLDFRIKVAFFGEKFTNHDNSSLFHSADTIQMVK